MPRYVLRYGSTRSIGLFTPRSGLDRLLRGTRVIARTSRGLEAAEVLAEATDEQARQLERAPGGQIMREMTPDDANELAHLQQQERSAFETCQRHVLRLALPMQLVDLERVFGGERLIIYYLAEERVDFRDLVKSLASEFQTRIEMRQIGVRDEAKLLADYGDCGQPVCCGTFLSEMPPVSMKMAKVQKATLDPTKISGRCGRLKCCLRYEYDVYEDLMRDLPPIGSDIVTTNGRARVLGQEILAQQLLVAMEDNRRILIPASDVLTVLKAGTGRRPDRPPRDGRESSEREPGEGDTGGRERTERPPRGTRQRSEGQRSESQRSEEQRLDGPTGDVRQPPNTENHESSKSTESREPSGPRESTDSSK
jgi:cell fate regulator YaaT (PSP1 superfamily)